MEKEYEFIGKPVIIRGYEAKFYTGSDYPVVLLRARLKGEVDFNRLLIVNNLSDLRATYPEEKYGDVARDLAEEYKKAIVGWFKEKNKGEKFIDGIGFQSLYFGGLYKGKRFLGVALKEDYVVFRFDLWGDEEGFLEDTGIMRTSWWSVWYSGKEFNEEKADFMRALHTISLFREAREVYGYTEKEKPLPPVPQEVIDCIVKVIPEWRGLKNDEIVEKFTNDEWISKVRISDDIYALAYAVRKYVAGLIITGKTAVEGDFLEVWKAYEDEMVKELGREDLRIAFNLEEIKRFMTNSRAGNVEKKGVKEMSIGL